MARVILNNETYNAATDGSEISGSTGTEQVNVFAGVTDLEVASNVERVDLPGDIADFTFSSFGNSLTIRDGNGDIVAQISGADGKEVVFGDGALDVAFDAGTGVLTVGGETVGGTAAAITPAASEIDTGTTSETAGTGGGGGGGTGGGTGQTFVLTTGTDNIVGTSGNDLINGLVDDDDDPDSPNTFGPGDVIDGGAGIDTLRITQIDNIDNFGDGFGAGALVSNVEILEIRQAESNSASFDLSGFTGLEQIVADMTYDTSYEFYNLSEELVSITLNASRADDTERDADFYLYDMSNSIYTGDDDTLTINVINAGSEEEDSAYSFSHSNLAGDEVIENYNVVVGGDDNYLLIENDTGTDDAPVATLTASNMSGNSGSLFLELDEQEDLESLDASGMTGDFKFEFDSTDDGQEIAVTTGSGNDDIVLDDGVYTVDLGDGDDRVELDAFGNDADDTDDDLDGGAGRDTISMDPDAVANLLTLDPQNFEVLALNASAAAAVIVDADDYGFEEIALEVDLSAAGPLTIEDFNGGTLTIEADQAGSITIESNTLADMLDIIIDDTSTVPAGVTLSGGLDLTDIEMVAFSSADEDSDLVINTAALDVTGVDSVSFSGEGDVDIDVATTGVDDVSEVDLSGMTGSFDNNGFAFFGVDTDVLVGNLDDSYLDLSGTAGSNTLEFGAALDNMIDINNFDEGAGVTADVLDLAALGVTGLGDLTFTDNAGDLEITSSAFDGTITLIGVIEANLAVNNFDFA
ncbi:MAG: hypothetical protein NWQ37_06260 [Marivita lacus]|nr:hypothetical protein [Marivita lacus]